MYLQSIFVKCNISGATTLNESKKVENYSNILQSCRWNYKIFFYQGECIYDRHSTYENSEADIVNESTYVKNYSNIAILEHFYKWNFLQAWWMSLWQKLVEFNLSGEIPTIDLQNFLQPWRKMKYLANWLIIAYT